jgi:hypothetical protein
VQQLLLANPKSLHKKVMSHAPPYYCFFLSFDIVDFIFVTLLHLLLCLDLLALCYF